MLRISLNSQIFYGALFGIALGLFLSQFGSNYSDEGIYAAGIVGNIFIDLLKLVLVPLVFTSIVVGIINLREIKKMHYVWGSLLAFSLFTSTLSVLIGISASNIFGPGKGLHIQAFEAAMQGFNAMHMSFPDFFEKFLNGILMNPILAMSQGNVLAIVFFAVFVGVAIIASGDRFTMVTTFLQELFELTMVLVNWVMRLAPIGVMALLTKLVATESVSLLGSLAKFVFIVLGTTLFHGIVILPLVLYLIVGISPIRFWSGARSALITAFSTSSSSATMPVTMRCLEKDLGVSKNITGFVVPLGSHLNMDGTALYEAAAALFVSNLVGVELSIIQQIMVCLTAMIVSIGAPGIPSAGMVTMVMVLQSVGLPAEAVAILLPVDRLLDTVRTAVNVEGDMVASLVVQKLSR